MTRSISFRNVSIQKRLPLLICLFLLSIVISFGWISYISVRHEALKTGRERLIALSTQLSGMLAQSAQLGIATSKTAADKDAIKRTIVTGDPEDKIEALEILRKLRTDSTWVLAEILDKGRHPILRSSKDSALYLFNLDSLMLVSLKRDPNGIGKIYLLKGAMFYFITAPVMDNKDTMGYLLRWQKIATSKKAVQQITQLMGAESRFYIGNNDGSLWTDLSRPLLYPQINAGNIRELQQYKNIDGRQVFAMVKPIANTSWLVAVEFPKESVLATAGHFLRQIIIIGSILIVVGIFLAWLMSRNISRPLNRLTAATSQIEAGNYAVKVAVDREDELGRLARAFNAMTEQVSRAKEGLEQKVSETADMNEQLRGLSAYLQNVREDERIHIAREMHDELGQLLTGFKMDVSLLRKRLTNNTDPVVKEKLEYMLLMVDEAVKFVRNLASELRPSILDDLGLIPALEWHSREFEKRHNIKVDFKPLVHELTTSSIIATGLFRIYQESMTNVARHSNATRVAVSLSIVNDEIILSIADNGKGFDPSSTTKKTLGLLGMRERATMLGGRMDIVSEPGKGTNIVITIRQPVEKMAAL
jgi:signal transduction histidine kinase